MASLRDQVVAALGGSQRFTSADHVAAYLGDRDFTRADVVLRLARRIDLSHERAFELCAALERLLVFVDHRGCLQLASLEGLDAALGYGIWREGGGGHMFSRPILRHGLVSRHAVLEMPSRVLRAP